MFGRRFFAADFFGPRYFGDGSNTPTPTPTPTPTSRRDTHDGVGPSVIWKIPSKQNEDWKSYKKFDEDRRQHLLDVFNELVEPAKEIGIPAVKIAQAKKIIYRDVPELNVGSIQKDLIKVKEIMRAWQEQIDRAAEEDDEAALLLLI